MSSTPTALLVHGIRASRSMWRGQLDALAAAEVPVVAPDLPGHGSRRGEPFTVDGAVAALDDAAAQVDGPIVVVGMSLGGYLAIHWAARTARRPAAVLAASCCTQPRGPGLAAYRRLAALIGRLPDGGAALNDAMARWALPAEALSDLRTGGMALDVMDGALAGIGAVDPLADLRALGPVPVWLVNGRWDHFRTQERQFLQACTDGRLVIIPRATHLVSLVAPVPFNRVLLEVVAAAGARGPDGAGRPTG